MTPTQRFATIVGEFQRGADITVPSDEPGKSREFGSSGLRINGRMFAMLSSNGDFVVKLPRDRVNTLVAAGEATRFDPGKNGHLLREWAVIAPTSKTDWLQVAREARTYVAKG